MWKWLNDTTRGAICSGPHLGKAGNVCPPAPAHLECVIQQNQVGAKGLHPPGSPRMLMLAQEAQVRTTG